MALIMSNPEFYIDHEVRIRIVEKTAQNIHNLLKWILGTIITIGVPVLLHAFNLI